MKIQITTQSDTLFGTASGGALVDSTTRHDKYGFPVIPAKTLKGLLRESAQEVLEMVSQSVEEKTNHQKSWLGELFGKEGVGGQGRLSIGAVEVVHYQGEEIQRKDIERENGILAEEVLDYFTRIRYQTAIDDFGIAKKGSLRSARVIKKDVRFETALTGDLNDADKNLLHLACLNLRRAGTNRNRGWGRIRTYVVEMSALDINDAIKSIKEYVSNNEQDKEKEQTGKKAKPAMSIVDSSGITRHHVTRDYKITFLSPVLLPKEGGDANTVSASKVIPGRKILGMLASKYIQKKGKNSPETKDFTDLFLNGDTRFFPGFTYQKEGKFFPLGNHWSKPKSDKIAFSDYEEHDHGNAKSIKGLYSSQGKKADTVSTILDFHNSRNADTNSRVTGKNQGDGIYYYEAIAAGQSFWTQISGEKQHLEALESLMGEHLRLGKAAHTQYGLVKMEPLGQNQETDQQGQLSEDDIEAVITFVSPVLLKGANTGEYNPSLGTLKQYLDKLELSNKNCRFRTQTVKVFQGKINRQLPEALALAPGSSFQLKNLSSPENRETIEAWAKNGIGEATHEGYGQILVETNELQKIKIHNLEESMQADEKEADGDPADDSLHSSNNLILEHIWKQKQINDIKSQALKDVRRKEFHKNTVTLMIKFWKDVLNDGKFSEKEMKKLLSKALRNDIPKKPLENLEQLLGKGNQFQPVDKKEGLEEQKKYAGNLATKVLEGFSKYTSIDRKLENNDNLDDSLKWHLIAVYWLQYFSMLKLNNRKKNENESENE